MFHCNGWCFTVGASRPSRRRTSCLRRVEPGRIWELLETEGVTHYCGAPTVQIGMVNAPAAHRLERPVTVDRGRRAALAHAARAARAS